MDGSLGLNISISFIGERAREVGCVCVSVEKGVGARRKEERRKDCMVIGDW